jgi:hypothetical protein
MSQHSRIVALYLALATMLVAGTLVLFRDVIEQWSYERSNPYVAAIDNPSEWRRTISNHRCILFVDCGWSLDVAVGRRHFSQFAVWCRKHSNYLPLRVMLDANDRGEMWNIVQELWKSNSIDPGGKPGAAGRIYWLENGRVVDYAWCNEFPDKAALVQRTQRVFK